MRRCISAGRCRPSAASCCTSGWARTAATTTRRCRFPAASRLPPTRHCMRRRLTAPGRTRAQPLRTIADSGPARFDAIGRLIAEWQPAALVVGVPFHPDGAPHDNTERARRFARQLHGRFRLPVHEVDERYTTTEAQALEAGDVDAVSAAIILEQFLKTLP